MSRLRVLWHLLRADFLERVRRYGFLVTLLFAAWLGYLVSAGTIKLWIGNARGVYDSAWVGALTAMVVNSFLSLAGFYVIKNAVERDRQTGVGQILASTPMSKPLYTLGKTASNLAVLGAMVGVLAVFAVVTQWVVAEDPQIHLWPLLSPFLLLALPVMALVAALTVLFETIPWLRGGFGNVVWFALWTVMMAVPVATKGVPDPIGMTLVAQDMQEEVDARFGKADRGFILGGMTKEDEAKAQVFRWQGLDWTPGLVLGRLSWFALAVGISLTAALFFDRFDPAKGRIRLPKRKRKGKEEVEEALPALPEHVTLTPLAALAPGTAFRFPGVLAAELRLALKGQPWWWYAAALGLIIAGLTAPVNGVRQIVLPLAWIWPLLIWSPMGNRESRFGTGELLFSAPRPVGRQLPAVWMAGVLVAAVVGGGVAARYLMMVVIDGDFTALAAWAVGALFIPSLALALGVWSGSSKLFEAVYLFIWYIGPMNRTPELDYLGATDRGQPLFWLAATALLAAAAAAGRKWQLHRD